MPENKHTNPAVVHNNLAEEHFLDTHAIPFDA